MKGTLEAIEHEETLCDEEKTEREYTYLGDSVNAGGGCEAAVIARTRCGWVILRQCGELLYGKISSKVIGAVYKSYVRSAILHDTETLCQKENKM